MKKSLIILCALTCWHTGAFAQRRCGIEREKAAMIAHDPSWAQRFEAQRSSLQGIADHYKEQRNAVAAERTTDLPTLPVIFHIIVSSSQLALMGGYSGIAQRVNSQIDVLNQDFNRGNSDSSLIPWGWKPLYANVGIRFGLAHTSPIGWGTAGYEVRICDSAFFSGTYQDYSAAKYTASGGLDAWDNTKYINVWCIYFADDNGLLGVTTPRSYTTTGAPLIPNAEIGICINFEALGKRASAADNYIATSYGSDYYDQGRTLTHEMAHLFEIWHTWGDDFGSCPGSGGADDGLADTPPEADHKFFNYPNTIPGGTYIDSCHNDGATNVQPYGISSLDYLNYTDDVAMHMFTLDQAAAMDAMVLVPPGTGTGANGQGTTGESYSLTQHPVLLTWPANTGVAQTGAGDGFNLFPNPTTGTFNITFGQGTNNLRDITVTNMLGQEVLHIQAAGSQQDYYSIDLSGMSKGIYFVRCNFASGSISRKILLQ